MRITKAQLKGLDQYKYSGIDKSVVSRYALGPFWTWLVTIFPRSLAPNTVSPHCKFAGMSRVWNRAWRDGILYRLTTREGEVGIGILG